MRATLGLLFLASLLTGCQQQRRCFVDLERVIAGTADGKRASEEWQRVRADKQRQVGEADAAAKKAEDAKEPDAAAKRAQAVQFADDVERELADRKTRARAGVLAKAPPALERVAADHHIDVIDMAGSVAWFAVSVDVTAEVVSRMDAIARSSEVDALKAENERLKAKAKP